jgi:2-oxoisovalerate dehydrogenase E2 component (dihydrolipoyl transacylase)
MGQYSFKLPDVGEGTAEAEIAEWRVKVGDRVEEDQPLVEMMTDKATVELTSPVAGVVQSIAGKAGEKAAVGSVLVVLETAGTGSSTADQNKQTAAAPASQSAAVNAAAQADAEQRRTGTGPVALATSSLGAKANAVAGASRSGGSSANAVSGFSRANVAGTQPRRGERPAASPAVRRRAEELGIKLQFVRGTGPTGRILHADLDAYLTEETGNDGPSRIGHPDANQGGGTSNNYLYTKLDGGEDIQVIGLRRQIVTFLTSPMSRKSMSPSSKSSGHISTPPAPKSSRSSRYCRS